MSKADKDYSTEFSDEGFWEKLKDYARSSGEEVTMAALKLYYAYDDKNTPTWAKATIIAALGYFISPIDAIPDIVPVVGFSDDLGVLVMAVGAVAAHINSDVKKKAKDKFVQWFG